VIEIEELRRLLDPGVKDLRERSTTALLCGVSDGHGKVCGRSLDINSVVLIDQENLVATTCPKHRGVICHSLDFVAALDAGRPAVHFRSPSRPEPLARRSSKP
jgi:hypothetical protein